MTDNPNQTERPLAGVRVIDDVDGGCESTGRLLADLGADVIRLEPPGGARSRREGPEFQGIGLAFAARNVNKRGVTLDLSSAVDRGRFTDLLRSADIYLHNTAPETLAKQGFSPDELRLINPRLVTVSISDFGRFGPRKDWIATSDVHFALSSVLSRSGLPEVAEPLLPPQFLAFEAAAIQAAWAAILAYINMLRTGAGDAVDFSISDGLIQVLDPGMGIGGSARSGQALRELPPGRPDARHLYPIFPALDGHVRICVLSARQWQGMFDWLGEPEEFADPKYNSTRERFAAAERLYPLIGRLFAGLGKEEAVAQGQSFGVPTAALASAAEVLNQDAFREAGAFADVEIAKGLTVTMPTGMLEIDDEKLGIRRPAPYPGQDNAAVFAGLNPDSDRPAQRGLGAELPFDGLKVLDLGVIVVGGELGRLFADYGAEVIKIESREFPDGSRQSLDGSAMTEGFAWGHRNKQSLGLNLKSEKGRDLFRRLAKDADVVLTNFKPGTLDKLGLGYDTLTALNPGIILSESSAFGNHGPWRNRMGYGPLVRASAGLSMLWQYPDIPGSFSDAITIYPDHVGARLNAVGVAALLLRRQRTGRGGRVGSAQVDIIFGGMADQLALESVKPDSIRPEGNDRGGDAPRGVFKAAGDDNWVVIDVVEDKHFAGMAKTVGRPDWLTDPGLATAAGRLGRKAELESALSAWTSVRNAEGIALELQQAGVPAGHMARICDLEQDQHLNERGVLGTLEHEAFPAPLPTLLAEARFGSVPAPQLGPAPYQGEHTRPIARAHLGLTNAEIQGLLDENILQEFTGSR